MVRFARFAAILFLCSLLINTQARNMASTQPIVHIRVNQVGYTCNQAEKHAVIMSGVPLGDAYFTVANLNGSPVYTAHIGKQLEKWNGEFPHVYQADFSVLSATGEYVITLASPVKAESPAFRIDTGANLYGALLSNTLSFYQAQRDGPDQAAQSPLGRVPCHLEDESAYVCARPHYSNDILHGRPARLSNYLPVDVSGGWFDAGDYLKFVETASYVTAVMLVGARDYPGILGAEGTADFSAEGRFGLEWLLKMWDDETLTLYYQVGIGDGNANILGDHDWWRLPEEDDALAIDRVADVSNPKYYIKYRPAFQAGSAGSPVSPNLAGRLAACFALGYQVFTSDDPAFAEKCLLAARHVFDLAETNKVTTLTTASPADYYPETEWRDDMELGAVELYRAMAMGGVSTDSYDPLHYLELSCHWAAAYINSSGDGDFLNLYDVAGLAHRELYLAMRDAGLSTYSDVSGEELLKDSARRLNRAARQAAKDPFGLGVDYTYWELAPTAVGMALEASFYHELSQSSTYVSFSQNQIDFVFGRNAWGTSFVVGAGTTFPHCLHHQIANLSGSLDGTPPVLLGAVTAGPAPRSALRNIESQFLDGMRVCGEDAFDVFSGQGARYMDDVRSWPTVEPALDYTALTILLFARLSSGW